MRVSQTPIAVSARLTIGAHEVTRTGPTSVTFDFDGPVSPYEVANINAAIRETGVRLETYWRLKDANGKATLCVKDGKGSNWPAVGKVVAGTVTGIAVSRHITATAQPAAIPSPAIPAQVVQTPQAAPSPIAAPVERWPIEALVEDSDDDELVSDEDAEQGHRYIPNDRLTRLWASLVRGVKAGRRPRALMFLGPSGSGKTDGAIFLANLIGLPFTKVDAASMTDAESWFGTREVINEGGVSVTRYVPSAFVLAIQKPGVTLIDEANRVRDEHRNVLYPLMDGTRRVLNPLTGQVVQMHPEHYLILSGNRGLAFTGTYAMDPALMTRCLVVEFDYLSAEDETAVTREATGCDERTAKLFVRFAGDVRAQVAAQMALGGTDLSPVSTRQVIAACELVHDGLDVDEAVETTIIALAESDGGSASVRQNLRTIWTGIRPTYDEVTSPTE